MASAHKSSNSNNQIEGHLGDEAIITAEKSCQTTEKEAIDCDTQTTDYVGLAPPEERNHVQSVLVLNPNAESYQPIANKDTYCTPLALHNLAGGPGRNFTVIMDSVKGISGDENKWKRD